MASIGKTIGVESISPVPGYAIETHGLTKRFNNFTAVDHVNLNLPSHFKITESRNVTYTA